MLGEIRFYHPFAKKKGKREFTIINDVIRLTSTVKLTMVLVTDVPIFAPMMIGIAT